MTNIPAPPALLIRTDDVSSPAVIELLLDHLRNCQLATPPESTHALNLDGLRRPEITLWTIWSGPNLAGCGALKHLDAQHAEIKSMRTAPNFLRQGIAAAMLQHLLAQAQLRGYSRVSLETGAMAYFEPARRLYANFGFVACEPFANYIPDPNSVFLTKEL
ncbi:putative N-acetyltransferase YsnE [Anatilimnocola aggregata]|uniref:Putative N-acetyltransferase YsnE n=1 Tax=Anatilimnocola aggregata TaxID=2528021 RepID=A0A517YAN9_9BACT|nr:GNAT family N-acetyltransferase [Anatilimnocola aggregata]QDU27300.1 putative N-acetyltransferase YsnE [Anatilimnocola aggregata]